MGNGYSLCSSLPGKDNNNNEKPCIKCVVIILSLRFRLMEPSYGMIKLNKVSCWSNHRS